MTSESIAELGHPTGYAASGIPAPRTAWSSASLMRASAAAQCRARSACADSLTPTTILMARRYEAGRPTHRGEGPDLVQRGPSALWARRCAAEDRGEGGVMPYTSLLVPLDYGPQSDRAVQIAGRFAARAGVPIELITVTDPRLDPDDDRAELLRRAEEARPVACFGTVLRSDDVSGALAGALHERPDALPIIGTSAPGPLLELFDPGVWETVLAATGRPALLVGPHATDGGVASRPLLIGVTPGADPRRLADVASRWTDTFDVGVSVLDLLGEGGLV